MVNVLMSVVLLALVLFLVVVGFCLLVLTNIIRAEDVRRWFNRNKGE